MRQFDSPNTVMSTGCDSTPTSARRICLGMVLRVCVVALTVVMLVSGCRSTGAAKSVAPGINQAYRDDPDVAKWRGRFETESREIYRHRQRIADVVGVAPGDVVADIGAGTGLFTVLFAERVGPHGRVMAVDLTPEFIESIDDRAKELGLTNVETVLCKADSVELPAASIDLAFICDTYHHFEYPAGSMESLHRALKSDGELVVIDFERIPGESRPWVLDHVRAGREVVATEIEAAGFERVSERIRVDGLEENYMMRFRKTP